MPLTHVDHPVFTWNAHPDATRYRLILRRNGNILYNGRFKAHEICFDGICRIDTTTIPDFPRLRPERRYVWFVVALTPETQFRGPRQRIQIAPRLICPESGCIGTATPVRTNTSRPTRTLPPPTPIPPSLTPIPPTLTRTSTRTLTRTATRTPSWTPTATLTASHTATITPIPPTATLTPSVTLTPTPTPFIFQPATEVTPGVCEASSDGCGATPVPTLIPTRCISAYPEDCETPSPTPTRTPRPIPTRCINALPGDCATPTPSSTPTSTPTFDLTQTYVYWDYCTIRIKPLPDANNTVILRDTPQGATIGFIFSGQELVLSGQFIPADEIKNYRWYHAHIAGVSHWLRGDLFDVIAGDCNRLPERPLPADPAFNSGFYCVYVLSPPTASGEEGIYKDYCQNTVYARTLPVYLAFVNLLGREPTHREMITITMQTEYWANTDIYPQIRTIGTEAISRAYFQNCGLDECNIVERLYFLSGYQPWLLSREGAHEDARLLMLALAEHPFDSSIWNEADLVLMPIDNTWYAGKIDDQPWQWFNRDTSLTRPNVPSTDACQGVLFRAQVQGSAIFEMYTAAQDANIKDHQTVNNLHPY